MSIFPGGHFVMKRIDLRSDTVTTPTPAMREAMYRAEVGDDVYGEDPTVNRLEEEAARLLGKEAALFTPTGTQANQIAVLTHVARGEEVIVEAEAHIFFYEAAGIAALAGAQPRQLTSVGGVPEPDAVAAAVRKKDVHFPRTALVCLENTHNRGGGVVLDQAKVEAVCAVAHKHGAKTHLDGARLFNAAIASGKSAAELARPFDSVMFCLSKGLAAPVGSMLVGSKEFIARARHNRKLLGGGMRQAGILAAAGLVALAQMIDRLAEDHANARALAEGINNLAGVTAPMPQTNMVFMTVTDPRFDGASLAGALTRAGVACNATGPRTVRLVTHKDVAAADIPVVLARLAAVLKAGPDAGAGGFVYG
jgi:threonine aldolase